MTERINAVQRMFWALFAVGLCVAGVGIPLGNDRTTMAALDEQTRFAAGFDRAQLERALLGRASAQGMVALSEVARAVASHGVANVSVAKDAAPIAPRAAVALATLAQVEELTAPSATIAIASLDAEGTGQGLAWRLSRRPSSERYELLSVALSEASCSTADIEHEQEVARARTAVENARAQARTAEKRQAAAQEVYDLRRKWKATWKAILKANETRLKTQAALQEAQTAQTQAEQSYEALAKRAEAFEPSTMSELGKGEKQARGCAVAIARLLEKPSGRPLELRLPVPIDRRAVAVARLTGADFPVTRAAGFWNELKDKPIAQAIERLRERFSWHYRYIEIAGMKLGGMTVLQFAPLALLPLFWVLIRRSRSVSAIYNPFDRPAVESLPSVGLGMSSFNLFVLVVLPFAACVLCSWSLLQLGQVPIVPLLCALAAIALGGRSHLALKELLELREAIVHSHSNPPPAPNASAR